MTKPVEFTAEEQERLQRDLAKQLGPEFLSSRSGPGGGKFTYIEGQTAIQLANEHFGFNGWRSEMKNFTVDFLDEHDGKFDVGVSAHVRVTLKDGTFHEDIGYGSIENSRSKAAALEKAKKEAMTDALKRTLRMFGNSLGNCIYDKNFTKNMQYMKKPTIPFDPKDLHRDKRYKPQQQQQSLSSNTIPVKPQQPQQSLSSNTIPIKLQQPQQSLLLKAAPVRPQKQQGDASSTATLVNTPALVDDDDFYMPDIESQELKYAYIII